MYCADSLSTRRFQVTSSSNSYMYKSRIQSYTQKYHPQPIIININQQFPEFPATFRHLPASSGHGAVPRPVPCAVPRLSFGPTAGRGGVASTEGQRHPGAAGAAGAVGARSHRSQRSHLLHLFGRKRRCQVAMWPSISWQLFGKLG